MRIGELFTVHRVDDPGGAEPDAPESSDEDNSQASEPDLFDAKFDPASLPPELQPAYQQMRTAFHGKTQTLAEERQGMRNPQSVAQAYAGWSPEERMAFFEQAGLEYDTGDDDDDDGYDGDDWDDEEDDTLYHDPRVDVLIAERQQEIAAGQQHDARENWLDDINDGIDALEESLGRDLSPQEVKAIGDRALHASPDQEGLPDVVGAYEDLTEFARSHRESAARPTPWAAPSGVPGREQVDLTDTDTRRHILAQEIAAAEADDIA